MKRLILSISMFALYANSFAQSSQVVHSNMLEGNPIWEYYSCHCSWKTVTDEVTGDLLSGADPQVTFYYYYLDGNMTSNGKSYKRLCRRTISPQGIISTPSLVCGIREHQGKIIVNKYHIDGDYGVKPSYMLECQFPPYSWDEEVLLDFSLLPGQKLYSSYYYTKDDSVYFKAISDKEITLEDGSRSSMHNIQYVYKCKYEDAYFDMIAVSLQSIDDIGYLNKFIPYPEYGPIVGETVYHLNRFWRNSTLLYSAPRFEVTPEMEENLGLSGMSDQEKQMIIDSEEMRSPTFKDNPYLDLFLSTTAVHDVINKAQEHEAFFDLQGRQLRHKPEKGLYIQNGKVRMAR